MYKKTNLGTKLQSIAQAGLTYSTDPYDRLRFKEILDLSSNILSNGDINQENFIKEIFDKEYSYPTPKIGVLAAIFKDNKIMLVQEKDNHKWSLPGGWADVGDSPRQSILKEIREETNLDVNIIKFAALLDRNKYLEIPMWPSVYKCFFICQIKSGEAKCDNLETIALDFYNKNNLPELSLDRVTYSQIMLMFDHYNNPELPTSYD